MPMHGCTPSSHAQNIFHYSHALRSGALVRVGAISPQTRGQMLQQAPVATSSPQGAKLGKVLLPRAVAAGLGILISLSACGRVG